MNSIMWLVFLFCGFFEYGVAAFHGRVSETSLEILNETCHSELCYPGVHCYNTCMGAICGSCPRGYVGNGKTCVGKTCQQGTCFPGVQCKPSREPPYYSCGPCPKGFIGDGIHCQDENECELADPCDPRQVCTNLYPGYRCEACPAGFIESHVSNGIGVEYARRHKQQCIDVDECSCNNGGCVPNSFCVNTEGSFHCGDCKTGYAGNQNMGCLSSRHRYRLCPNGTLCGSNAVCQVSTKYGYKCVCLKGWSGDGYDCIKDLDLSEYPRKKLKLHVSVQSFPENTNYEKRPIMGRDCVV